jgi:hypothetical protein
MIKIKRFSNGLITESLSKSDVQTFINDFGFFLYMNLSKVKNKSNGKDGAAQELDNILVTGRKPLINGKSFTEIVSTDDYLKNPKYLSALFQQIKNLIEYIEPRITRFVEEGDTKAIWLGKLENFKSRYKDIIAAAA